MLIIHLPIMLRNSFTLSVCLSAAALAASDGINDGKPSDSRPYNFPEGPHAPKDIITLYPDLPHKDSYATTYGGQIAAISGFVPGKAAGDELTHNSTIFHLVRDEHPNPDRSYVSHITLGNNICLNERNISMHVESRQPAHFNIQAVFGKGTLLNLSGDVLADITRAYIGNANGGVKIYSSKATITNSVKNIAPNLEFVKGSTIINNIEYTGGGVSAPSNGDSGNIDKINGTLIFHDLTHYKKGEKKNNEQQSQRYEPLTILGDIRLTCMTAPRSVAFYSEKKANQEPDDGTPIFICNSANKAFPGLLQAYGINKHNDKNFYPTPNFGNCTFTTLGQKAKGKSHFKAQLGKDGRVYICYAKDANGAIELLPEAHLVEKQEKFNPEVSVYRIVGRGLLDMTDEEDNISLDNITAGDIEHGAGAIRMRRNQIITINGHKTIRHAIYGEGEMILQGQPKDPIYVSYERLLHPKKDNKQAFYELHKITANHATAYIGPGNVLGKRGGKSGKFVLNYRSALLNYGVVNGSVWADRECRITNSHLAETEILKHDCKKNVIPLPTHQYPGTIGGSVYLNDGAEFTNYGSVHGNIDIGSNCVLYGSGNCQGTVNVNNGGVLYIDSSLSLPPSKPPLWAADVNVPYVSRPNNTIGTLCIQNGGALGFRVRYPMNNRKYNLFTAHIQQNKAPMVKYNQYFYDFLKITDKMIVPKELYVRVDIDGELLAYTYGFFRVPLFIVTNKQRIPKIKRTKLSIGYGAELVENAQLEWNEIHGALYLTGYVSEKARKSIANKQTGK